MALNLTSASLWSSLEHLSKSLESDLRLRIFCRPLGWTHWFFNRIFLDTLKYAFNASLFHPPSSFSSSSELQWRCRWSQGRALNVGSFAALFLKRIVDILSADLLHLLLSCLQNDKRAAGVPGFPFLTPESRINHGHAGFPAKLCSFLRAAHCTLKIGGGGVLELQLQTADRAPSTPRHPQEEMTVYASA